MNIEHNRRRMLAMTATGLAVAGSEAAGAAVKDGANAISFLEVNGARLAYQRNGGGGRQPMVFLHGYALRSTGAIYSKLFQALRPCFDIYALDMRGHGGSAASIANWSQTTIADDVAAFTRAIRRVRIPGICVA